MSTEKIEVVVSMFERWIFDTDDGTLWGFGSESSSATPFPRDRNTVYRPLHLVKGSPLPKEAAIVILTAYGYTITRDDGKVEGGDEAKPAARLVEAPTIKLPRSTQSGGAYGKGWLAGAAYMDDRWRCTLNQSHIKIVMGS